MRHLLSRLAQVLGLVALLLVFFAATAFAADQAIPPDGGLLDVARPAFDAIMRGHYIAGAAFALVFCVALFKRYAPGKAGEFARTDVGGVLTTWTMSFFGALGTATLATGSGWGGLTLPVLKMSGGVALVAMGGYAGVKKLLIPLLRRYQSKFPAWTAPGFVLFYFLFDKPDPITEAEKAGAAAVKANPPQGIAAVTGDGETF